MNRLTESPAGAGVLLLIGLAALAASRAPQTQGRSNHPARPHPTLTEREERELGELMPQALAWAVTWTPEPTSCPPGVPEQQTLDLRELYNRYEGREVEMRLDIGENDLKVYLIPLHTSLSFTRLHDLGLSPPRLGLFCKDVPEEIRRDHQVRSYSVAPIVKQLSPAEATWGNDKQQLYARVLEVVQREACFSLSYSTGKSVKVTVPDFEVGDPEIYVLFEGPPSKSNNGTSIEWIDLGRDSSSGAYTAEHMKNFGRPDETKQLAELIRRKRVRETVVECSEQ